MMALIAAYINPVRDDKDAFMQRLMTYTDFLKEVYKGLKIIIFADLNMKKFCRRRYKEIFPRLDFSQIKCIFDY